MAGVNSRSRPNSLSGKRGAQRANITSPDHSPEANQQAPESLWRPDQELRPGDRTPTLNLVGLSSPGRFFFADFRNRINYDVLARNVLPRLGENAVLLLVAFYSVGALGAYF